jgi:hypothetical protein
MRDRDITIAWIAAAAVLGGCVLFPSAHDRALRKSPAFQDGYSDGCAAATTRGANYREGPFRDEQLYKTDAAYRAGWSNGFQTCRSPAESPAQSTSPVPEPVIGSH